MRCALIECVARVDCIAKPGQCAGVPENDRHSGRPKNVPPMTRRQILLAFVGIVLGGMIVSLYITSPGTPVTPKEYQAIHLGMTVGEANGILGMQRFRVPAGGPGFSGRLKDEQKTKECDDLRWKDIPEWHRRYQRVTWRDELWSIDIITDANEIVVGKSLVLIDCEESPFIRTVRLWIRKMFGV